MKVNNTIPLPNDTHLIDCLTDDVTVKLIGSGKHVDLITLDPESLGIVSRSHIGTIAHNFYTSCIDDNCVYLPTKFGQILALDKFSGEILATINLGMPIMSDLSQDEENIYCICGVPLSRKWEFVFSKFCVCICDKETGKKKVQTNYFKGNPSALLKNGDFLWIVSGDHLLQYSSDGEYIKETLLGPDFDFPPIMTKKHIICVSSKGLVLALDQESLNLDISTQARPCISKPELVDEKLIWVTPSGICHADFKERVFQEIGTNNEMLPDALLSPDKSQLFAFDRSGMILSFNIDTHAIQSIKLTKETLRKPVIAEDFLLVLSATQLHQLKVQ